MPTKVMMHVPKDATPTQTAEKPKRANSIRGFDKSLPMALLRARESVMRRFRSSLRKNGLTEQQWRVLRALTSVESIEVLALAEVTFLLPPSMSRIVRDLEHRKLIVRRAAAADRRRGLISISRRGLALIDRIGPESEAIYAEITRRLGGKEMDVLLTLLKRLEQVTEG